MAANDPAVRPKASAATSHDASTGKRSILRAIGPGLITASVVIGPGSILTSSRVGADFGFAMVWVLLVAVVFMMLYTVLGAKLGVVSGKSAGDWVTQLAGRPLAAVIGIGVFFISASFQFGNNLGVHSAFDLYRQETVGPIPTGWFFDYAIIFFNALSIGFVFLFKNLYKQVERLMMAFVSLMLFSFAVNLAFAKPSLVELLKGFFPTIPQSASGKTDFLPVLAMIGTTFVISAAYYQSYLVRQKGWGRSELRNGILDARVGSVILALITLMIMGTSAAVLRGQRLGGVGEVAAQLKPLFGTWGQVLFCLGLFSAAYSSFLVNSMIGGFILADGLGLGSDPKNLWPRVFTTAVLLTGMTVGLLVIRMKFDPVPAIVMAQAVTVIASPLMAGVLLWLTSRKDVMGQDRNGIGTILLGSAGFLLLVAIAVNVAIYKVAPGLQKMFAGE